MFTVAPLYQIMDSLGLKDSPRKLVASCAISFVISPYLILHAYVQTFDVTGILEAPVKTKHALNTMFHLRVRSGKMIFFLSSCFKFHFVSVHAVIFFFTLHWLLVFCGCMFFPIQSSC